MIPTGSSSSGDAGRGSVIDPPRRTSRRRRPRGNTHAHRVVALVSWSVLGLLVALAIYYGWRTASNQEDLTQRNLRELGRIAQAVEDRSQGFAAGVVGWRKAAISGGEDGEREAGVKFRELVPHLLAEPQPCTPGQPRAQATDGGVRFCFGHTDTVRDAEVTRGAAPAATTGAAAQESPAAAAVDTIWWSADFDVDPLEQALQSELFDATFLADDSASIFLTQGPPGLRLHEIPRDTARGSSGRVSTVRAVTIAGRDYQLFLQPLEIRGPESEPVARGDRAPSPVDWTVGGLVSTSRFRAESLALDPPHLIFFGLLLILAVLALPYLRAGLMGPWESIKVADVYLLAISLVLGAGLLGITLADLHYFGPFAKSVDANLATASDRLAGAFGREIERGLREMDLWQPSELEGRLPDSLPAGFQNALPDGLAGRVLVFDSLASTDLTAPGGPTGRYLRFQMLIWVGAGGRQGYKVTPREKNTPLISVADREYFRRIRNGQGYRADSSSAPYFLESIRSRNTGERIAMLAAPYCWSTHRRTAACAPDSLGIVSMTTRLASLYAPVLPPGVRFAVIQPDGLTLFHSNPERNLEENFLKETGDDGQLRAIVAAGDSGTVRTTYMGRRTRLHVRPLPGTPLSLVLALDESLPATAHFESLFVSMGVFLGWVLVVWAAFLVVDLLVPGRLRWAWPDRTRPWKYRLLTRVLVGFAGVLAIQAGLAAMLRLPVEEGTLLVPFQALGIALLVQSAGRAAREPWWRDPRSIGWAALALATLLQLGLYLGSGSPAWYRAVLWTGQAGMVALAVWRIRSLPARDRRRARPTALEPWYVGAIVAALATTALIPAYLFHEESLARHGERLIHYEQVRLLGRLRDREDRIHAQNLERDASPAFDGILIHDSLDAAVPPVLGIRVDHVREDACPAIARGLDADVFSRVERRMPFVTGAAVEMRRLLSGAGEKGSQMCGGGVLRLASDTSDMPLAAFSPRLLQAGLPAFGAVGFWRLLALLALLGAGAAILAALARWLGRRVFFLDVPDFVPQNLLGQLPLPAGAGAPTDDGASIVAICTRSMDRAALQNDERRIHYVDALHVGGEAAALSRILDEAPADALLVIDHFDHRLDDAAWRGSLLPALEEQVLLEGRRVVLLTSHEPCALFPLVGQGGEEDDPMRDRWTRLLGYFVDVSVAEIAPATAAVGTPERTAAAVPVAAPTAALHGLAAEAESAASAVQAEPGTLASGEQRARRAFPPLDARAILRHLFPNAVLPGSRATEPSPAEHTLQEECGGFRRLEEIADQVRRRTDFHALTPDAVVEQVRDMSDSYYHALWNILEHDEKLVVSQLAQGVVVNPNGKRAARRLLARRILVRDPELRLMNRSFQRFIREEVPASAIAEGERGEASSAWQRLRFPLVLGLAAVAAFLFVTQRSAFDSAIAVITAAGVGATALLRIISSVRLPARGGD